MFGRGLLVVCAVAVVSVGTIVKGHAAGSDLAGSEDPIGLQRFPHSWIVDYSNDPEVVVREFIISRVDKTRRDVRAENKLRTEARQQTATYRIPDGTPREEVIEHYLGLLGSEALFSCEGRDCGRSNHWANYIFQQAQLYGPDTNQFYLAVEHDSHLVAVYIIQRGNKRVYAHVVVFDPTEPLAGARAGLASQLTRKGYVVVPGVAPLVDGRIAADAERALRQLTAQLVQFSGQQLFVVCHIYGSSDAKRLLDAASRCSDRVVSLMASDGGPQLVGFAAGPMAPRSALGSRIELVLPSRLRDE